MIRAFLAFCILAIQLSLSFLPGAVIPVLSHADHGAGSLREAVAAASPGDTLTLALTDTLFLSSQILLDKPLTLLGNGAVLHGNDSTRHLYIEFNVPVTLAAFTFCHGNAQWNKINDYTVGGGAIHNRGQLTLRQCVFRDNVAGFGGAIEVYGLGVPQAGIHAKLLMQDCSFVRNRVAQTSANTYGYEAIGGAIFCTSKLNGKFSFKAINTTFSGNSAQVMGGAVYAIREDNLVGFDTVELVHCTITQNTANNGGGIEARPGTAALMVNSILAGNTSADILPDFRGTLFANGGNLIAQATTAINYDLLEEGSANVKGVSPALSDLMQISPLAWGHIPLCSSPLLTAANVVTGVYTDARGVSRGAAADIGAIERAPEDILITHSGSAGYQSLRAAVSLACPDGVLSLHQVTGDIVLAAEIVVDKSLTIQGKPVSLSGMTTTDSVRLLEVASGVNLRLTDLRLTGGTPALYGGGGVLNKGRLTAERCVFTDHSAQSGGAIACYGAGDTATLALTNCYFARNAARDLAGGAIDVRALTHPAAATATYCTFAENTASLTGAALFADDDCRITLHNSLLFSNPGLAVSALHTTSAGHNAMDDTTGMSGTLTASDRLIHSTDMQTLSLGDASYWLPSAGSAASDAAEPLATVTTDLHGNPRSMGNGPDIGAVEFDLTPTESVHGQPAIAVWPQPACEQAYVESSLTITHLALRAMDGRLVYTAAPGTVRALLPLGGLAAGVYALLITDTNGTVSSVSLLIQP